MKLYKPKCKELDFRRYLLNDPNTMSYNRGFYLGIPEYNNDTGCIEFAKDKWQRWYDYWMDNEPTRFYSFLEVDNEFIGEVALRYVESEEAHMINIVIDNRFRGMGYGRTGLMLLMETAFNKLGLDKIIDDFPVDREPSKRLFENLGFKSKIEDDLIKFTMTKEEYKQLESYRI